MAINLVTKYGKELDQKLVQSSLTADLETNDVQFLDAKTIKVPFITTSGYKAHTRTKGYNAGTVANDFDTYTLNFDRDIEFFVDVMDQSETGQVLTASKVTKNFIETNAAPETDAYRFSKMATAAITNSKNAAAVLTKDTVYEALKTALKPMRKFGAQNLICYVSIDVMDFLEQSTDFTRSIQVTSGSKSELETRVTSIDGVILKEVWATDRFKTAFDFTEGFVPAVGAKDINFLVVAKPTIIATVRHSSIYLHEPGSVGQGDGWLYQNRSYQDLFVRQQNKDGVYVHTTA